jgi:histidine phosphotransfer protein HptB
MHDELIDRAVFAQLQASVGAEFVSELIGTFLEEAPRVLAELRDAAAKGDVDSYRRAAHSLKSNAQTFGATPLAALSRELEQSPLSDTHAQSVSALEAEYAKTAAALTTLKG